MKYWVYINNEIKGPFEKEELIKLEGFSNSTLICPQSGVDEDTKEWKEAVEFPEIAALISEQISPQGKQPEIFESTTGTLNVNTKKDEVIIERFNSDNIFSPPSLDQSFFSGSTLDPLSLSQIQRREKKMMQGSDEKNLDGQETPASQISSDNNDEFRDSKLSDTDLQNITEPLQTDSIQNNMGQTTESIQIDNDLNSQIKEPPQQTEPLQRKEIQETTDEISLNQEIFAKAQTELSEEKRENQEISATKELDIEIPDTDSLIKTEIKTDSETVTPNYEGIKSNIEENQEFTESQSANTGEPQPEDEIVKTLESIKKAKLQGNVQSANTDEIKKIIETSIEEKINLLGIEILKEKINMLESKIEELANKIPNSTTSGSELSHLTIAVKDLETKLNSLEKKLNKNIEQDSPQEEVIDLTMINTSRNIPEPHKEAKEEIKKPEGEGKKTVVIQQNTESDKGKSIKNLPKKLVKILLILILVSLTLASILFLLKQAGIYDITAYFNKNNTESISNTPPAQENLIQQVPENSNANSILTSSDAVKIESSTQTKQNIILPEEKQSEINQLQNESRSKLEENIMNEESKEGETEKDIIKEIENYRINTKKTLKQAVNMVINYREADWQKTKIKLSKEDENTYRLLITSPLKNGNKILKFYFEYDYKNKIIKPLNTLSKNTLKLLMKKSEKIETKRKKTKNVTGKAISKKTSAQKAKKKSTAENSEISKQSTTANKSISQNSENNESQGDEFLIIGE